MKINRIKIENFYSIKTVDLNLDSYSGVTFIEGKNYDVKGSNGAGKSSIIEAIAWGIFGKTIRKSTEEAMVNNKAKKGCKVEIILNGDCKIIRTRRPTFLEFYVGDKNLTKASVTDTQAVIEEYFNTNYKIFLASMIYGQNNELDFISASPEEKRTIIKNFLNLTETFAIRDRIKDLKSDYSNKVKSIDTLLSEYISQHKKYTRELDRLNTLKEAVAGKLQLSEDIIKTLTLQDIIDANTNYSSNIDKIWRLQSLISTHKNEINYLEEATSKGAYTREKECDSCGSKVKVKYSKGQLSKDLKRMRGIKKEISKLQDEIKELESKNEKPKLSVSDYKSVEEYHTLKSNYDFIIKEEKDIKDKLLSLEKEKKTASKNYEIMRFWEAAFSEQGLIQYIVKNILEYFNAKCNEYLQDLSAGTYKISFNEKLEETIWINTVDTKFISLSGGEKKKVNFAVLFALQSLLSLTDKEQGNIIFFDEITNFLDASSKEGLYILLQKLKKTKKLFIITHDSDFKEMFDQVDKIVIAKKNGVSYIK